MSLKPVITISGYAASGKTTVAKKLADNLGFGFVDLGSIIRRTTLDYLNHCGASSASEIDGVMQNQEKVARYIDNLDLYPECSTGELATVISGKTLNINDEILRSPILDDITLGIARLIRPRLIQFQRECAELSPVVFSARNSVAFEPHENIRVHINPGRSIRIRRRARYEGEEYVYLSREKKRDVIQRVVGKEWRSAELGIAMNSMEIEAEHFHTFKNLGSIDDSLRLLTSLSLRLMKKRGWVASKDVEGSNISSSPERY